jgi:arylsulfatase A-like enzyme
MTKSFSIVLSAMALASCSTEPNKKMPNIIIILADDMGYSDIGCFGGEIPTPNIDMLAGKGVSFTQFYNNARCCPTRASLLTGLYSHQAGVGSMVSPGDRPGYLGRLSDDCLTFAEVLREAGYQTFLSGKWHVTHYNYADPEATFHQDSWPIQRGFDRFFGTLAGAGSFFTPVSLMLDNEFIEPGNDFYYTDEINDYAARFIREADADNPFVMYVSHVAPHWPLHAKPEHIEMFKGVYDIGWDKLREQRYDRMLKTGIIGSEWPLSPREETVPAWIDEPHKEWESHRMAVYAAQMYSMDAGIGRIIQTLKETGRYENTIIMFFSDNGGCNEIIQGTDTRHGYFPRGGTTPEVFPGGPDTYASYGVGWANASNTPYRLYKKWIHEGGIATPFILHWPALVNERVLHNQVSHIIDLMPTLIEISGASYPDNRNGVPVKPLEGISLLPFLRGEGSRDRGPLFWEHMGNRAVRDGNWKLVSVSNEEWELYDMVNDRTELNNIISEFPEKAEQLRNMWEDWAIRANVK